VKQSVSMVSALKIERFHAVPFFFLQKKIISWSLRAGVILQVSHKLSWGLNFASFARVFSCFT